MMILHPNQYRKLSKKYIYHKEAYIILKKYYGEKDFNDPRKKCQTEGKVSFNPSSAAPGFVIKNVICLPGVPQF